MIFFLDIWNVIINKGTANNSAKLAWYNHSVSIRGTAEAQLRHYTLYWCSIEWG